MMKLMTRLSPLQICRTFLNASLLYSRSPTNNRNGTIDDSAIWSLPVKLVINNSSSLNFIVDEIKDVENVKKKKKNFVVVRYRWSVRERASRRNRKHDGSTERRHNSLGSTRSTTSRIPSNSQGPRYGAASSAEVQGPFRSQT